MPVKQLKDFLDERKIRYTTLTHSPAYTALEIAAAAHVPGKELAKTVMLKLDDEMALAVMPASRKVDLERFQKAVGAHHVELAREREFDRLFPGCEAGAMPPFGNLYGMRTFVDQSLAEDEEIAFNAGNHTELMRLSYSDFERLAEPIRLQFCRN